VAVGKPVGFAVSDPVDLTANHGGSVESDAVSKHHQSPEGLALSSELHGPPLRSRRDGRYRKTPRKSRSTDTASASQGVFTYLLENLGVKDVQFEELLSLDPDALAELHPVYGVIFLFKFPTNAPYTAADKPLDGTFDHEAAERIFFATQTIQNACGTQALLSVLLNKNDAAAGEAGLVDVGPDLAGFRDFAMALPPEFRGEALSNSELIRDVHNAFARSSPFADETRRADPAEADDAFHFVAYTPVAGTLYELDGLQPAPVSHGPCDQAAFPARVMDVLRRRVARYSHDEIRFNLLALVGDLRLRARLLGDAALLAREERKRRAWQFENALRRHNFVGFAAEVLRGVAAARLREGDAAYDGWIADAQARLEKRIEERSKARAAADEDEGAEKKS